MRPGSKSSVVESFLPLSLLASGSPSVDCSASVQRMVLDPCCWVDHVPGLVSGGDQIFADVVESLDWFQGRRLMWGNWFNEPRLSAETELDAPEVPAIVRSVIEYLDDHYDRRFEGLFCNFYRSGDDGVSWHRDRIGRSVVDPLVAIISLGGPRQFALRDRSGESAPVRLTLHSGDLLVMGGATQHHWEHAVPKARHAPPRISLTARAGWPVLEPGETARFPRTEAADFRV